MVVLRGATGTRTTDLPCSASEQPAKTRSTSAFSAASIASPYLRLTCNTRAANQHRLCSGSQRAASLSLFWCRFTRGHATVTLSGSPMNSRALAQESPLRRASARRRARCPRPWRTLPGVPLRLVEVQRGVRDPRVRHPQLAPRQAGLAPLAGLVDGPALADPLRPDEQELGVGFGLRSPASRQVLLPAGHDVRQLVVGESRRQRLHRERLAGGGLHLRKARGPAAGPPTHAEMYVLRF